MQVTLNGEACQIADELTVAAFIDQQQLTGKRIAVEVNLEILPRSQFAERQLHEGDRIEIVHAIGGG